MLRVSKVEFAYRRGGAKVLDGLSFTVRPGEVVAIVGRNGSGKSTIGKLLAGAVKPTSGQITVDGIDVTDKKSREKAFAKLGIVFQNPENQIIFNTIREEVQFTDAEFREEDLLKALETVEMTAHADEDLYEMSLGQKQRMVLAEILTRRPQYIVLDEPTTMLDGNGKEKIYEAIRRLKKEGRTVVCITNLADEILLADRTLILAEGKIVAEIARKDLLKSHEIFEKYGIREPVLLRVARGLGKSLAEVERASR